MTDIAIVNLFYYAFLFVRLGICLYAFAYINKHTYLRRDNKTVSTVLWVVFLSLCIIAVTGDYWTYMYWYNEGGVLDEHMEPIWINIKKMLPWNYTVFRAIVWGSGLVLMTKIIYYCRVNKSVAFLLFGVFYILYYCYARAAIALAFILFGFIHLYLGDSCEKSKFSRRLIFIVFSLLGLLMHRSIFLIVLPLLIALWIKLDRNSLKVLILLFPLLSLLFNMLFPYLTSMAAENEFVGESASNYLSLDYNKLSRFFKELTDRLPMLILYGTAMIKISRHQIVPHYIRRVSTSAFLIIYLSLLFATVTSANGITFFYRIINMAYPFMIITVAYALQYAANMKKITLICIGLAIVMLLINIRFFMFINPNAIWEQMNDRYLNLM